MDSNILIEQQLDASLTELEKILDADVVTYVGPIGYGADDDIRDGVESIDPRRKALAVILETFGGYIEVAERIANVFRHHYDRVSFVVPNVAMSAGTVLVMSGDSIYMNYYSVLGPIDPQVRRPGSDEFVPALGYLAQYERLIEKSRSGEITPAEIVYLLKRFDPAELYRYEQDRELSISLLKEWLVRYKFKDWRRTQSRRKRVTKQMRTSRAGAIAKLLNNTDRWHAHSRGITMETIRRVLKLQIEDFGESAELNASITKYYRLLRDYMMRRGHTVVLQVRGRYTGV